MKDEEKPKPSIDPSKIKFKLSGMQHKEAPLLPLEEEDPPPEAPPTEIVETTEEQIVVQSKKKVSIKPMTLASNKVTTVDRAAPIKLRASQITRLKAPTAVGNVGGHGGD